MAVVLAATSPGVVAGVDDDDASDDAEAGAVVVVVVVVDGLMDASDYVTVEGDALADVDASCSYLCVKALINLMWVLIYTMYVCI
jgi:hypothetical protein